MPAKKQVNNTNTKKTLKYKLPSSFKTHKEGPNRVLMATAQGKFVKLSHGKVHYNYYDSSTDKPLILCIHGLNLLKNVIKSDIQYYAQIYLVKT